MLNYDLTEEQNILRKTVRDFAEQVIKPKAEELDEKAEFSVDITKQMAELGLFGMFVSEEYGGSNVGYISYIIAVEEIARVDGSQAATVAAGNSLGIGPINYFGDKKQKDQWLPRLCAGEILASFGLTEPNAGSDAGASKTTAVLKDGNWIINGSKIFITNSTSPMAGICTVQTVSGTRPDGKKEVSCILVPSDTPGFKKVNMTKKMMWRSSDTGELYFDDVTVPEQNLLGKRGEGFHQMLQTLDGGRLSIAAMGLGGAQGAFEEALKYAKEREQFGKPIGKFQVNAFKLADMAMEIEAARNLLYKACWLREQGRPFGQVAAMAKLYCSEVMYRAVNHAVQLHGGYGLMKEYPVERFYRDQKLLEIGEGTSEVQRIVISRNLGL
ncbi:MAG: acyl-CoA dehydrogenase family protein [Deltaproteobacteria bacterium]|nr:acyl-CoA dehydrogenase family protein [Candidatus Zymogenaceae bacterium]